MYQMPFVVAGLVFAGLRLFQEKKKNILSNSLGTNKKQRFLLVFFSFFFSEQSSVQVHRLVSSGFSLTGFYTPQQKRIF